MSLFQYFKNGYDLTSRGKSYYKIECDSLSDTDIECLAYLLSKTVDCFSAVHGVPEGGSRIAEALEKYRTASGPILVVDDVFTTGRSIKEFTRKLLSNREYISSPSIIFRVIFARNNPPDWIIPLFQMKKIREEL